ncbi:chloride conductance regulatory protein ICln-like [Zingiber officinale]|uniref:chloride conductance regulatory protein ICln-like n=1 Tax=Zingiber officinale TaxID=94328 RepID=UPI001C4D4898|nr:chloride conductance regulatory protein ICln-like [Zingiber officinale]
MGLGMLHFDGRVVDDDGRPLLESDNGEELMHVEPGVAVALGSRPMESPGTLYVISRRVIWLSDVDKGKGYAVDFLSLSLHAVSRDLETYPFPCIYTQIKIGDEDEESESLDSESNDDLELSKVTEMRLLPLDVGKMDCKHIYEKEPVIHYISTKKPHPRCLVAGCLKILQVGRVVCDALLTIEIDEMRLTSATNIKSTMVEDFYRS